MSILVDERTRLLVQGITDPNGAEYTHRCLIYGTKIVAGIAPGKAGEKFENRVPLFDSVAQAVQQARATASLVFGPADAAGKAVLEAAEAGLKVIVCTSDGVSADVVSKVGKELLDKESFLIGPNSPGVISPLRALAGTMSDDGYIMGIVGMLFRGSKAPFSAVAALSQAGIGQSTCIGLGEGPVTGTPFSAVLPLFERDLQTRMILIVDEMGDGGGVATAESIKASVTKPVVAFISSGNDGAAEALRAAGVTVVGDPDGILPAVRRVVADFSLMAVDDI
ncbi:MAG: succinate--CoA ligase subunit alpha [Chloroflexi bacterium]|nr:succinate--CoA ligase subunit alpha [Chloroflexota bacterium]